MTQQHSPTLVNNKGLLAGISSTSLASPGFCPAVQGVCLMVSLGYPLPFIFMPSYSTLSPRRRSQGRSDQQMLLLLTCQRLPMSPSPYSIRLSKEKWHRGGRQAIHDHPVSERKVRWGCFCSLSSAKRVVVVVPVYLPTYRGSVRSFSSPGLLFEQEQHRLLSAHCSSSISKRSSTAMEDERL